MKSVINKFAAATKDPYARLAQWKEQTGGKIIGCFPMYVPEEIIHAAGMLPIILLGSDEPIIVADKYIFGGGTCHLVRNNLDDALQGRLDFLDGVVFPDICDNISGTANIWRWARPSGFYHHLPVPVKMDFHATPDYLSYVFNGLRHSLEEFSGSKISEQALGQSISIYNHNRSLLRHLYQLRRANPSLLRAREVATVVEADMLMPKEEHSELLTQLLAQLEAKKLEEDSRVRLVLAGNFCEDAEKDVLDLVEEGGGAVADDDFYAGSRYFITEVDETIDPITALVRGYIKTPCPSKHNPAIYWDQYLLKKVKEAEAKGIVIWMVRYCTTLGTPSPYVMERLREAGVPCLLLETDHTGASGAIRTRLQAFIEMLKGK